MKKIQSDHSKIMSASKTHLNSLSVKSSKKLTTKIIQNIKEKHTQLVESLYVVSKAYLKLANIQSNMSKVHANRSKAFFKAKRYSCYKNTSNCKEALKYSFKAYADLYKVFVDMSKLSIEKSKTESDLAAIMNDPSPAGNKTEHNNILRNSEQGEAMKFLSMRLSNQLEDGLNKKNQALAKFNKHCNE